MPDELQIRIEVTRETMRSILMKFLHTQEAELQGRVDAAMAKIDFDQLLEVEIQRHVQREVDAMVHRAVLSRRVRLIDVVQAAADRAPPPPSWVAGFFAR